ncbi:bifunctional glycosyltransferase/CDP-glycerol:glycerophosphate glycerophosphotransferase [Streptomyces sp. H27-D2]|uniref:bifunctional glycosyltransferase/CDP-glycerol:glycerophosphate glycerophosphotransferase n=1 Tax=Streptomyces sp. H27-D2 TaxID=3046304 RepID=UPI002DBA6B2F|nr:bifunctional glycosyltransferase family 2 protein/CDP-glycerol:glycerophosphate glycerophosphotransferase [Streptomyces sp. H27-D2]MEC4020468.1 bifunctional glycosyltransferase family 2 protein/CDP-glycerol:glycerophosphate glycerophosphotransferase [Streptomyces sp. H27-D2]
MGYDLPRFSVIVPVFKVQAYLQECLESVLVQSFADFELIAVDDCSPDACGAIIDEAAARDPRVTAVHLGENVGLGRARNAGIERATGDYLIFLDSDDTLVPGSLRAIADRIAETAEPELLVYDYARTYWSGEAERNARAEHLVQQDPQVFKLTERPGLLRVLMVVWNKAYRRDFIERHGFTFPPGFYEDTPWTFPALFSADTIAVLDRVCVHYRQRRQGNILGTTSRMHFDVFDQYDRVFGFLDSHPEHAHWHPVLFRRMLDHFTTIFNTPGRLPHGSRPEFFRRSRAQHRRHHVAGPTLRSRTAAAFGRSGMRYLLVRLGTRRTFQFLWGVSQLLERTRTQAGGLRLKLRAGLMQAYYRLQLRRRVDPCLAVFSAYWDRGYGCNPAAIEAKVRELAPHIRTAWITTAEHAHTLPLGVRRIDPDSAEFWSALARAAYLVNNVNFPHRYRKRAGQLHLQTHHGTPLKRLGLDLQDYPAGAAGMDFDRLLERADRWDHSLSANRHSTLVWERAYPSGYTTLEYGYPRNDVFQRAGAEDVLRIRAELGIPAGATAVLYAPTHRDYRRGYVPRLDVRRLARALGPDVVLLNRLHYFYDPADTPDPADSADRDDPRAGGSPEDEGRFEAGGTVIDVSQHPSVEELCLASDALLTDYSSIMFDYANLDRPIVVHADDWEVYRAARGVYFDVTATPPGLVSRSEAELIDIFSTPAWHGPRSAELRAAFRARYCPHDDGRAAERVVRRLFLSQDAGLPAVVPLEARRPAPSPARALEMAAAFSVCPPVPAAEDEAAPILPSGRATAADLA